MSNTFRKGLDKVQEAANRSGSGSGGKTRFIQWKPEETHHIRFLTDQDDIVMTFMHEWVLVGPPENQKRQSFVCRREVKEECELCGVEGVKRREMAFGIAVERSKQSDGSFKTMTEEVEVEEDGKTVTRVVPVVGVVRQAPKNFWGWFFDAYEQFGTLTDRDYSVTRHGKNKDTTYQNFYSDKSELDASKFADYLPDLEEFLTRLASKEFYDWNIRGISSNDKDEKPASDDTDLTTEDLEALKAANEEVKSSASSGDWD